VVFPEAVTLLDPHRRSAYRINLKTVAI